MRGFRISAQPHSAKALGFRVSLFSGTGISVLRVCGLRLEVGLMNRCQGHVILLMLAATSLVDTTQQEASEHSAIEA